jgi:predicted ester cyclase
MSQPELKELARRAFAACNEAIATGRVDLIDEFVDEDYIDHASSSGELGAREGLKQWFLVARDTFSSFHSVIEDMVAEGDKVAIRFRLQGLHDKASYMGVAPTGRQLDTVVLAIYRFSNGKTVERWAVADKLQMIEQLRGGENA